MTSTERRPDGAEGPTSSPAQIIAPEHHHGGPSAVVHNGTCGAAPAPAGRCPIRSPRHVSVELDLYGVAGVVAHRLPARPRVQQFDRVDGYRRRPQTRSIVLSPSLACGLSVFHACMARRSRAATSAARPRRLPVKLGPAKLCLKSPDRHGLWMGAVKRRLTAPTVHNGGRHRPQALASSPTWSFTHCLREPTPSAHVFR